MEPPGDNRDRQSLREILDDGTDQGRYVQGRRLRGAHGIMDCERIDMCFHLRRHLKLDGRLSLVGDLGT